jgi:hypothetical protein
MTNIGWLVLINVPFSTSYLMASAAEILVYGNAVVLEEE